jgi:hypothetical protein
LDEEVRRVKAELLTVLVLKGVAGIDGEPARKRRWWFGCFSAEETLSGFLGVEEKKMLRSGWEDKGKQAWYR